MCGLVVVVGDPAAARAGQRALAAIVHRGPDAEGMATFADESVYLGHRRLSIIDLSDAGTQPMSSPDGRYHMVFNGEIYNYRELREELLDHNFVSATDSEVALAAFAKWGPSALQRFIGMFAIAIWDDVEQRLWCGRDRFGVKPLYHARTRAGGLVVASEITALQQVGLGLSPDAATWSTYLATGYHEGGAPTFWEGISSVPAGHTLTWQSGRTLVEPWYDLVEQTAHRDERVEDEVIEEYTALLVDSVRLRFRSDVPVGINLSGGLDSSLLLGTVHELQGPGSDVAAFTFTTGHPDYDELPWVQEMIAHTRHPLIEARLDAGDVPALASSVWHHQSEPFGGLPTLAYARLFEVAQHEGVTVLLDGHGIDEQWAGYDYYARAGVAAASVVQGTASSPVRPGCLRPGFAGLAVVPPAVAVDDPVLALQYRDLLLTKIPRGLRYNDRVSMRVSRELREPFLDHRLVELALRQPLDRKIRDGVFKYLPRRIAATRLPAKVVEAPKRAMQTPQREWLRGPLRSWAHDLVEEGLAGRAGDWLDADAVRSEMSAFFDGRGDNSFYLWQWLSLGLMEQNK